MVSRPGIDMKLLRILNEMWKLHGLQAKMTLLLGSRDYQGVAEVSEEITTHLKSVGDRLNAAIDEIEKVLDAAEAEKDGGH